jgi:TrpR-related protein YerC/YecD
MGFKVMIKNNECLNDLVDAFLSMASAKSGKDFISDLCTPMEIRSMCERWKVAQLLYAGMPYRKISEKTGISTTTVTRVARALKEGTGYISILKRMEKGNKE